MGFAARVQGGPGGMSNAYLASLRINPADGKGRLFFFNGADDVEVPGTFTVDPKADYRLQFSAVGDQLDLRVVRLGHPQVLVAEGRLRDSTLTKGPIALWVNTRGSSGYMRTVDNFFMTGTTPGPQPFPASE